MVFNSFEYVIFLPIVFIIYWLLPPKYRWILLLGASYYFYMSWNPKYVFLIFTTTLVSYVSAIIIEKSQTVSRKKIVLIAAAIICLGLLFFFKYFNFASYTIASIMSLMTIEVEPYLLNILLPVGISFYTFQTLSYVIDVYRGEVKAERHFGYYATFVSFFPQLVAGPIERTNNLLPQIKSKHVFEYGQVTYGMKLILWGMFKKMCIADALAIYVDMVYNDLSFYKGFDLIIAIVMFSIQIYCDFSGYSDIAIGSAKMLGINLMTNFKSPYFATSIKEFWVRWHISLSTWFRDYLYIPLGGNRCSRLRHYFNLLVMFLVSGLWHGANWTFVAWGAVHGIAEIVENMLNRILKPVRARKLGACLMCICVFVYSSLAWVLFRAESFKDAIYVYRHMFDGILSGKAYFANTLSIGSLEWFRIILVLMILTIFDYFSVKIDVIEWIGRQKVILRWGAYIGVGILLFLFAAIGDSSFIYFQF